VILLSLRPLSPALSRDFVRHAEDFAMLEFRVLGTLELATPFGTSLTSVRTQPKRVALLAYLALARPRGAHSRDQLLALLWPELDESHARAALRQAVHHLRQTLGEQAIIARGYDELRLEPRSVDCDALTFEAELDADHPESALALYRGDLLEGFFLAATPGFEEWLERERARLRARAASGAWALAELRARDGNVEEAASWGARALALSHDDEAMLQRLLRLLEQLGDRVHAVLEYDAFVRRVRRDYEMEPSLETRRIIDGIRAHIEVSLPARAPPQLLLPTSVAREPLSSSAVASDPTTGRLIARRAALGATAALLVTTLVVAAIVVRPFSRASAPLDANLVIVAPFGTVAARDSVWREGLADLFGRAFDGAGPLRTVPASVALHAWSGRADRASALALARRTGAGLALFGAISPVGVDSSRVAATLVDAATGSVIADHELAGAGDHMQLLADSIAVRVLIDVSMRRGVGTVRPAGSIGSNSLPAIKEFLRGDQAFRRAEWDSAETYYEQAVAQDSTFALAIRQLGRLAVWRRSGIGVGMPRADSAMLAFAQRASRYARGLGARDSLLVLSDSLTGAVASDLCEDKDAHDRLLDVTQKLTARFPTDPEAWVTRGDALFVCGGYYRLNEPDIGKREILQAYDSAIVLDPDLAQAYDKTFRLALDLGDTARVLRYAAKYLTLHPSPTNASYLHLIATLLRTPENAAAILDTTPGTQIFPAYASLLLYPDSAELIVAIGRRMASTTARGGTWDVFPGIYRSVPSPPFRDRALAFALAYRGHLREASALAGTDRSGFAPPLAGELAVLGALPRASADSAFLGWLHERPFRNDDAMSSVIAWWGEQCDTSALREYLQHAQTPWRREDRGALYAHWVQVAEGYIALARADTSSAIRLLASLPSNEWWVYERLVAARLLVARSRLSEAFAVLDRGVPYPYATPLRGLWAFEHARLASRLGKRDKARESYEYVVRVWRTADPELQQYVREARAALTKP
jgi:serine/threonine-protein kinase